MSSPSPRPATHPSRAAAMAAALLGALALGPLAVPATAQPVQAAPAAAVSPAATPAPATGPGTWSSDAADTALAGISPELGMVAVDGPYYRTAAAALASSRSELADVQAARSGAEAELARLAARDQELTGRIAQATTTRKRIALRLSQIRTTLRTMAVTAYVQGTAPAVDPTDLDTAMATMGRQTVFEAVSGDQSAQAADLAEQVRGVEATLGTDVASRVDVRDRTAEVTKARDEAAAREAELQARITAQAADVDQARARAFVQNGDGMSLLALDAYWRAAHAIAQSKPECGIQWWALAGIGRVEGHHGTFGGSHLRGTGDTSRPILGIVLDGTNDTASIPDTDGGALDGDPSFDHAVGPMQFIPSTWARWKADGNSDGTDNPQNMYDAVLAAAQYLCASGPMVSDDDLTRGYLSYNHSDDYAAAVLADALYYRANVAIPPVADVVATAAGPAAPAQQPG